MTQDLLEKKDRFSKDQEELNSRLLQLFEKLNQFLDDKVKGQEELTKRLLIALLADGHILVEGPPGLAKTRVIKILSLGIASSFHRIQFTPDLLPADLTGTEIYRMEKGSFEFQKGPLFHQIILADEINRAPAKVQAALLEAMAERQITVGKQTYFLPKFFLVMATQNPLEQEGTYPLPEAQLDRFLMKVKVSYPSIQTELEILQLALEEAHSSAAPSLINPILQEEDLFLARESVLNIHMSKNIQRYIVEIISATREPKRYGIEFANWIEVGSSSRGTIALARAAKALAFLEGQSFVTPLHVRSLAKDILRHRIVLSYRAEAEKISADDCIDELISKILVP